MSNSPPQKRQKIFGYNSTTDDWHCVECGISMGQNNPRQLCGKTQCNNFYISSSDEESSDEESSDDENDDNDIISIVNLVNDDISVMDVYDEDSK